MAAIARASELRRALPAEAGALSDLAIAAMASHGYGPELLAGWRTDLTVTSAQLRSLDVWTAWVAGELAGWGATAAWGRRCRLEHLWIVPARQRQGIGRILLHHLMAEAGAAGWTELEIESEPLAADFYLRCGARVAGVKRLTDGRQLPLFVLPLSERGDRNRPGELVRL
jgi:GNAT superfamily N-acetyltransferase